MKEIYGEYYKTIKIIQVSSGEKWLDSAYILKVDRIDVNIREMEKSRITTRFLAYATERWRYHILPRSDIYIRKLPQYRCYLNSYDQKRSPRA